MRHFPLDQFHASLEARTRELRVPRSVLIELTYGCNLRCVHCYNPTHRALPQELTTDEIFFILDQLADMGVVEVHFSGGEPLTRPDAEDIFRHAKQLGFILYLLSNATRINAPLALRLRDCEFESITVSMYGASKTTYERVTGIPGSYEKFLQGLDCLVAARVPLIVRMPVMTANAGDVHDARSFAEAYGVKFQYSVDITPRTDGDTSPLNYRLSPTEKLRVDQSMISLPHRMETETSCADDGSFISCSCGRNRFAITPYGEMNLCAAFPIPKYDLRKGTVREGWEVLKQVVNRAEPNEHDECPTCNVRPRCRQGRGDAWLETGDMSVCLPHYKELATLEMKTHELLKPRLD
jgi:radical SAM protein with 4Fe4S-binding SPASM domain